MKTTTAVFLVILLAGIITLAVWGVMSLLKKGSSVTTTRSGVSDSDEVFTAEFKAESNDGSKPDLFMTSLNNSDYLSGNTTQIHVLQDGKYSIYGTVCVTDLDTSGSSNIWTADLEIIVTYADGTSTGFPTSLPYNEYQPKTTQKLTVHQTLELSVGDSFKFIASRSDDGLKGRSLKISGDPTSCDGTSPAIHINLVQ